VLEISCIHYAGPRPFCLEDRVINLDAVPEAAKADFATLPPGPWLLNQVPWSTAEHQIRAISAEGEAAASLDVPKGTACLVVELTDTARYGRCCVGSVCMGMRLSDWRSG
jgi:GntR family histidine utilization transcriptional repressor